MKKHDSKLTIFLDIDGVLNTDKTVQRTPDGYRGIEDSRVELLANVIDKYGGADIVLSSDWKDMRENDDDYIYLTAKLHKYGLTLSGHTKDKLYDRGAGIKKYLTEHPEVEEYVVIDDNTFDFQNYRKIWERLILTNGIEDSQLASETSAIEALIFMDYIKEMS